MPDPIAVGRNDSRLTDGAALSQPVERTPNAKAATVQHVQVRHRRGDVGMPEQLLHGANVVAVLEEVRRKRVSQRILTLPMNPLPRSFTTVTIPSTVNT